MDDCQLKNFKKCCCTCKHLEKIAKHPWNKEKPFKGSIKESIGWGCLVAIMMDGNDSNPDSEYPRITFQDRGHALCELHQKR